MSLTPSRGNTSQWSAPSPSLDTVEACVGLAEAELPGIRELLAQVAANGDRQALEEAMRRIESLKLYADERDVLSVGHMMRELESVAVDVYYRMLFGCTEEELF